jgi:hypothetical protein
MAAINNNNEVQIVDESLERDSTLKDMCLDVLKRTYRAMEEDLARSENVATAQLNALVNVHEDRKALFRRFLQSMVTDADQEMSTTTTGNEIFKVGMHNVHIFLYAYMIYYVCLNADTVRKVKVVVR